MNKKENTSSIPMYSCIYIKYIFAVYIRIKCGVVSECVLCNRVGINELKRALEAIAILWNMGKRTP